MADLFSSAAFFLKPTDVMTPERKRSMRDLEKILMESPFLSKGEKEKMAQVIPLFSEPILSNLKESLIRQNLRHFKNKLSA